MDLNAVASDASVVESTSPKMVEIATPRATAATLTKDRMPFLRRCPAIRTSNSMTIAFGSAVLHSDHSITCRGDLDRMRGDENRLSVRSKFAQHREHYVAV